MQKKRTRQIDHAQLDDGHSPLPAVHSVAHILSPPLFLHRRPCRGINPDSLTFPCIMATFRAEDALEVLASNTEMYYNFLRGCETSSEFTQPGIHLIQGEDSLTQLSHSP